jgi:hypothetical protein
MKNLYNFILEDTDNSSKKFDNAAKQLNELPEKLSIFSKSVPDEVRNAFEVIANSKTHNNPFLFATGAPYFKMPYVYNDSIKETLSGLDGIKIQERGIKIIVRYITKDEKESSIKLMETGNGSLKKIPTDVQENATCAVFNAYMDLFNTEREGIFKKSDDINNEQIIKQVIKNLTQGNNIDSSWIDSFSYQVKTLVDYLKKLKLSDEEISNYRLARYGAQSEEKEPVSAAYSKMVKKYSTFLGGRKDAYDPTDILLFNKSAANDIISCCQSVLKEVNGKNYDDVKIAKTKFLTDIFKKNLCMGISLKKLSTTGKIELFNVDEEKDIIKNVTGFTVLSSKRGNNVQVRCDGTFQFGEEITDENGNPVPNEHSIMVTLRTFGANIIGMDVNLLKGTNNTGPAIGKCPVNIWRKNLEIEDWEERNIKACIDKFNEFLKTDTKVLEKLKTIIQGAVKEGPSCFPFILLH